MHTSKLTKIVATIGPASETPEIMAKLIDAGVNIFRFNTKHSTPQWHAEHIKQAQLIADEKHVTIGILLDLQGPEIRLETRDKNDVPVKSGQIMTIGLSYVEGVEVIIPHAQVFKLVKPGQDLLIDDGFVETEVIEEVKPKVLCLMDYLSSNPDIYTASYDGKICHDFDNIWQIIDEPWSKDSCNETPERLEVKNAYANCRNQP